MRERLLPLARVAALRDKAVRDTSRTPSGQPTHEWLPNGRLLWRLAGDCLNPVGFALIGRPFDDQGIKLPVERYSDHGILVLEIEARCRRCAPCLKLRAMRWRFRARTELAMADRTWFGTLTLRPEAQYRALALAVEHARKRFVDFATLTEDEVFIRRHNQISPEITKYLKRIRKESGAVLRYVLVAEAHKTGLPHYHLLLHEYGDCPARKEMLERQWTLGFSSWRLVEKEDKRAAGYVTKYLSKAALARVRASVGYGAFEQMQPVTL